MDSRAESIRKRRHHTILIVEREVATLDRYKGLFSRHDAILFAQTGSSALSLIQQPVRIDLLLLEYRLPDFSGIKVLKAFRATRPAVPAIVFTAYGSEEVALDALRSGATDYLEKPCHPLELVERITSYLGTRGEQGKAGLNSATDYSVNLQRAIRFIDENYTLRLSMSQVAEQACLSYYHFSKTFKNAIGVSFRDYVQAKRIELAKERLFWTDEAITRIAHGVGFEDITSFERAFRKLTSHTPTEYRKKSRQKR